MMATLTWFVITALFQYSLSTNYCFPLYHVIDICSAALFNLTIQILLQVFI
jgi:hypothetical protein